MRKLLAILATLIVLAGLGLTVVYLLSMPQPPAADSVSARWLQPGPYAVGQQDRLFTDPDRPTQANGSFGGSNYRSLHTRIWYPQDYDGVRMPLIVHSHGFISGRSDLSYVAEHLSSYGYVVAAANFPLTHRAAPGGPLVTDVVHQPGDVSHIIDSLLALEGDGNTPFGGRIDPDRIGVMGYSLGGLTATLTAFHPQLRDPRVQAVVSVAGVLSLFTEQFFTAADMPFLMLAGTADAIVPYPENAAPMPQRVPGSGLISINGGSHIGFNISSEPFLRLRHNPDALSCFVIQQALDGDLDDSSQTEAAFALLGDESMGIAFDPEATQVCSGEMLPAIHPGRQLMMAQVAVLAFFESQFALDVARRQTAATFISNGLNGDFPEVVYTAAAEE